MNTLHRIRSTPARRAAWVLCATLLAACAAPRPPAPPQVDESARRPVNDPKTLEIQMLRHQLHNAELLRQLQGLQSQAEAAATPVVLAAAPTPEPAAAASNGNDVYIVTFGFGESKINLSAAEAARLLQRARSAAHLEIRGRTDGIADVPGEARVARDRAAAMRGFLLGAGVDEQRVRVTYQPAGDHLADNSANAGRSLNRRVEIELHPVKPRVQVLGRDATLS
jgi:outer membrane protein OmpA-like peptidoglycan-associated protein